MTINLVIGENKMSRVSIDIDKDEMKVLRKRAKKNLMTLREQVRDIIRRSCVNALNKPSSPKINVDDKLVSIFSRVKRKRKK